MYGDIVSPWAVPRSKSKNFVKSPFSRVIQALRFVPRICSHFIILSPKLKNLYASSKYVWDIVSKAFQMSKEIKAPAFFFPCFAKINIVDYIYQNFLALS